MALDSFIEWGEQADPDMARKVKDGYCSWEDFGCDPDNKLQPQDNDERENHDAD